MVKMNIKYISLILIYFLSLMTQITGQTASNTTALITDNSTTPNVTNGSPATDSSSSTTIIIEKSTTANEITKPSSSTTKAPSGDLTELEFILILTLGGGALIVMNIAAIICAVNQFKKKKKLEKTLITQINKTKKENIQLTDLNQELKAHYNERAVEIDENVNKKMSVVVNEMVTKRIITNERHDSSSSSSSSSARSQSSSSNEEDDEGNMRF